MRTNDPKPTVRTRRRGHGSVKISGYYGNSEQRRRHSTCSYPGRVEQPIEEIARENAVVGEAMVCMQITHTTIEIWPATCAGMPVGLEEIGCCDMLNPRPVVGGFGDRAVAVLLEEPEGHFVEEDIELSVHDLCVLRVSVQLLAI